ncbi:30S ribosomal protein S17 [Candidatus Shapirobacteria bacterium CG03_land_8_20_14_0_80_39_12]|uniref:Small ribosomal subunit protein uS17 n=1 Tax=Candidatus Shapirobacteria bacterium CG03_land_8_20_14_0_80_39_12 TaxID=1974879 RepID=A0A2M7BEP3_9BACT|nr:MAG: 30S ribosomal protein S17 [Candidatus Shapirobacteria bacterium CG03_land_8_20_14_0_80_39_12]
MKAFEGVVISDRMAKTAVVLVERKTRHPLYGKIISKKKKIHARNEIGAKMGQIVRITQIKPLAKTVSFKILEIVGEKEIKK